eukprot:3033023-Amphidinium_carterae.1
MALHVPLLATQRLSSDTGARESCRGPAAQDLHGAAVRILPALTPCTDSSRCLYAWPICGMLASWQGFQCLIHRSNPRT